MTASHFCSNTSTQFLSDYVDDYAQMRSPGLKAMLSDRTGGPEVGTQYCVESKGRTWTGQGVFMPKVEFVVRV